MIKNLDGIKKLTPEELKESREIVLNFIGENKTINDFSSENKIGSQDVVFDKIKKVDGITKGKEKKIEKLEKPEILETKKEYNKQEDDVNNQAKQKLIEEEKKQQQLLKDQESQQRIRDEEIKKKEEKIKQEQETKRIRDEEIKKKEEKIKQEQETKRIKYEEKQKEQLNKLKQIKKRKLAIEQKKQFKKQERKVYLANKIKKLKIDFKNKISSILKFLRIYSKKIIISLVIFFSLIIFFYVIFCEIVLGAGVDNKLIRQISKYVFVPALISDAGMVDYFNYKDELANQLNVSKKNDDVSSIVKERLLKDVLYKKLAKKYGLTSSSDNLIFELEKKVIVDMEMNQDNLFRITKIRNLLREGNSFVEVEKYGDGLEFEVSMEKNLAQEKFGRLINFLQIGQISDILVGDYGYYLVKKNNQSDDLINVTYIFIRAYSLDDYINNKFINLKVINLI